MTSFIAITKNDGNTHYLLHTYHEQGTVLGIYIKCLN